MNLLDVLLHGNADAIIVQRLFNVSSTKTNDWSKIPRSKPEALGESTQPVTEVVEASVILTFKVMRAVDTLASSKIIVYVKTHDTVNGVGGAGMVEACKLLVILVGFSDAEIDTAIQRMPQELDVIDHHSIS